MNYKIIEHKPILIFMKLDKKRSCFELGINSPKDFTGLKVKLNIYSSLLPKNQLSFKIQNSWQFFRIFVSLKKVIHSENNSSCCPFDLKKMKKFDLNYSSNCLMDNIGPIFFKKNKTVIFYEKMKLLKKNFFKDFTVKSFLNFRLFYVLFDIYYSVISKTQKFKIFWILRKVKILKCSLKKNFISSLFLYLFCWLGYHIKPGKLYKKINDNFNVDYIHEVSLFKKLNFEYYFFKIQFQKSSS